MTTLPDDLLAKAGELKDYAEQMKAAYEKLELERDALLEALEWATEELKSWRADQGTYGTEGYDKAIPNLDRIIAKARGGE